MVTRVLIIGGYGNFGSYIARSLAADPAIRLIVAGRSRAKADAFAAKLGHGAKGHALDLDHDIAAGIADARPDLIIHTTGPFQAQDYRVAKAAIAAGAHYCDLADARAFVTGIGTLDERARMADTAVIAGASSVPCLTAAVIDRYRPDFARLTAIRYGISAAQQTNRGLATTSAVLSYVGKRFMALKHGRPAPVIGWQDLHGIRYPELGLRLFGDCDIPDLDLFPARYPGLATLRFAAGHELKSLHLGTWALSWLVRWGLISNLADHAERLLKLAFLFDPLGSARSGFHMILSGEDYDSRPLERRFFLIARSGHGPYIPCMPAIILARSIAAGKPPSSGARPCLDLIELDEYLAALAGLDITAYPPA